MAFTPEAHAALMLWTAAAFLIGTTLLTWRLKGPVWAMSLAWLFCMAPIVTGIVAYDFYDDRQGWFAGELIGFFSCYIAGALVWQASPKLTPPPRPTRLADEEFALSLRSARLAWWVAIAGTALICGDFYFNGGAGLDDLAALRDSIVDRKAASLMAQLGSVMTWACLYCYIFALCFRSRLRLRETVYMLIPVAGYFLVSVLSAGRQTAFQIMLVTGIGLLLARSRRPAARSARQRWSWQGIVATTVVAAAMTGYMGYIAVARKDQSVSIEKGDIIASLFGLDLDRRFDDAISYLGVDFRSACIEGIVYFSSSVALFQNFLRVRFPNIYYGAVSVPFIFRQLQPITGQNTSQIYLEKVDRLTASGVLGVGWTTALSSYIQDFGPVGTAVFLALAGFYSAHAWHRAKLSSRIEDVVIGVVVMLFSIYMPLLPVTSDTNLLLLWLAALAIAAYRRSRTGLEYAAA